MHDPEPLGDHNCYGCDTARHLALCTSKMQTCITLFTSFFTFFFTGFHHLFRLFQTFLHHDSKRNATSKDG